MSRLNAEQKTIKEIFIKSNFLIPDYQRPYSWERDQCETLWEDLTSFAFPEEKEFDANNDKYFLGTILTFRNECNQNEVIDGQQRLVTFLLLLRAFYKTFENFQCDQKETVLSNIGPCIWETDEFQKPRKDYLRLDSEVAIDDDLDEFKKILREGDATRENKSNYAKNYRYFQKWIYEFRNKNGNFPFLPMRVLNNCVFLPIEADSQDIALRIFMTLNDRGMPLSDSDIFKAQFYKFYKNMGKSKKDNFVCRWRNLEQLCEKIFQPRSGTYIDSLFIKYMYYLRALHNDTRTTFTDMRKFYEDKDYKILHCEETFENLIILAKFWEDIVKRENYFSERVLKAIYILNFSPTDIWTHVISTYFLGNRDPENHLNEDSFYKLLDRTIAVTIVYFICNVGHSSIRVLFLNEFRNILLGKLPEFKIIKQTEDVMRFRIENFKFANPRPITRMILAWWLFRDDSQELPDIDVKLEIEHIYARKRADIEPIEEELLECLGNKALLEKSINIRASDYYFTAKKKYYLGLQSSAKTSRHCTFNRELQRFAEEKKDFTSSDIILRNKKIIRALLDYFRENNLLT